MMSYRSVLQERLSLFLDEFESGKLKRAELESGLGDLLSGIENLSHTRLDLDRERRGGVPEVVCAPGKTANQLTEIIGALLASHGKALATRVSEEQAETVLSVHPALIYEPVSRLLFSPLPEPCLATIGLLSAGTADQQVAEEAYHVSRFVGHRVERYYDVGIAGIHRLLDVIVEIRAYPVLIVAAGMDGALAAVVAGLVAAPIIALPTSRAGYGTGAGGISALLAMLNSCSAGVGVVNIDNGFGAAMLAHRILSTMSDKKEDHWEERTK